MLADVQIYRADLQGSRSRVLIGDVLSDATKMRADASDELAMAERLCHVVVRAEFQSFDLVLFRSERREHDHRDALRAAAHFLKQIEAVPRAEVHIENEEVGVILVELPQRARRVMCDERDEPRALERELKEVRQLAIVVDDEDLEVATASEAAGRVNQTFVPFPTSLSTPIWPRCASTIPLEIARPSPIPGSSLL